MKTYAVFHPRFGHLDHWMSRFRVSLTASRAEGEASIPVVGSGIDVRIGDDEKVIGFSSRWRPVISRRNRERISQEEAHEAINNVHTKSDEVGVPLPLVYRIEGDNAPQNFIAPYYMVPDKHHWEFLPASSYSLVARIFEVQTADGTDLYASVRGGHGEYDFEWGVWKPHQLEDGFTHIKRIKPHFCFHWCP